jgi:hypothetical protein
VRARSTSQRTATHLQRVLLLAQFALHAHALGRQLLLQQLLCTLQHGVVGVHRASGGAQRDAATAAAA